MSWAACDEAMTSDEPVLSSALTCLMMGRMKGASSEKTNRLTASDSFSMMASIPIVSRASLIF